MIEFAQHKKRPRNNIGLAGLIWRIWQICLLGVVGIIGVSSGLALGMLALKFRNEFLHFMNRMTGLELFPAAIYAFTDARFITG